jgi:hypothetical protein
MRKTLLIAAAALAGSVISSQAQVYSQNIVGYVNVPLAQGYTVLANQMDVDGTGTNNTVASVFGTNLLSGTTVYAWQPASAGYTSASWANSKGTFKWGGNTNAVSAALNAGYGVFIQSPATNNLTLVGTVIQATNYQALASGYNFVSGIAPLAGGITTTLGYAPQVGDIAFIWNINSQGYAQYSYANSKGVLKWGPSEPQVPVGGIAFIKTVSAETWTNGFKAQ